MKRKDFFKSVFGGILSFFIFGKMVGASQVEGEIVDNFPAPDEFTMLQKSVWSYLNGDDESLVYNIDFHNKCIKQYRNESGWILPELIPQITFRKWGGSYLSAYASKRNDTLIIVGSPRIKKFLCNMWTVVNNEVVMVEANFQNIIIVRNLNKVDCNKYANVIIDGPLFEHNDWIKVFDYLNNFKGRIFSTTQAWTAEYTSTTPSISSTDIRST